MRPLEYGPVIREREFSASSRRDAPPTWSRLTVQEAGNAGQGIPDEAALAFAIQDQRAVITINQRDFIRLHAIYPEHSGIIVCTQDGDIEGQAQRVHQTIISIGDLADQLVRVNRPQQ